MSSSLSSCSHFSEHVDHPRRALAERVRTVLDGTTNGAVHGTRVCVPVDEPVEPIQWLRAQEQTEAVYWADRSPSALASDGRSLRGTACRADGRGQRAVAGVGHADRVARREQPIDYAALRREYDDRFVRTDEDLRYYGGLRFDATQPARPRNGSLWTSFGTYRFVLPRIELIQEDDEQVLACNLVLPRDRDRSNAIVESIEAVQMPSSLPQPTLPEPLRRTDRPEKQGWTQMVQWALNAIAERRLEKVVLARQVELALERRVDPMRVLHHLKAATPGCFHFALRPPEGPTFVGASPERLFHWAGDRVVSEAVAGTRGRGDTPEADAALREELLTSAKERREHAFVQQAIQEDLATLCTSVDSPETPSELMLARGRHLHARLTGTLRSDVTAAELLDALHPTPAVGGVPSDAALTAIREQEPFDRGWYAGPVGWIGSDAAEFSVAIRSGLVEPERLTLFSGAGIVDGSEPEREWAEIEQKLGDFAAVLGVLGRTNGTPR